MNPHHRTFARLVTPALAIGLVLLSPSRAQQPPPPSPAPSIDPLTSLPKSPAIAPKGHPGHPRDLFHSAVVVDPEGNRHEIHLEQQHHGASFELDGALMGGFGGGRGTIAGVHPPDLQAFWPKIRKALLHYGVTEETAERARALADSYLNPDRRHMIGVQCRPLDDVLGAQLQLDHGVVVDQVFQGTPAEEAGVEKHDIILQADEATLRGVEDLVEAVQRAGVEEREITLALVRAGKKQELTMKTRPQEADRPKQANLLEDAPGFFPAPPGTGPGMSALSSMVPRIPGSPPLASRLERPGSPDDRAIARLEETVRTLQKTLEELKDRVGPSPSGNPSADPAIAP